MIDTLVESLTSPLSCSTGWAIGGAVSRVDPDATAVGEREVGFELVIAVWPPDDPDADRHAAGSERAGGRCAPTAPASTSAFLTDEGVDGVAAAYGDASPGSLRSRTATTRRILPSQRQHPAERASAAAVS